MISQDPEFQSLQENLTWPEVGSRFLQFDLLAELGRGAFGQVFLAREVALGGRMIVVKVAPRAGGEAEILGKLQHPNIVPVYSLQEDDQTGLAAFCMPYLGRATLADVLDHAFSGESIPARASVILEAIAEVRDETTPKDAPAASPFLRKASYVNGVVHLASQLADALAHSHGRGIYHRDLKPSNVLITSEGRPLLLDFNLSVEAGIPAWKIGGTLPYMAPEELAYLNAEEPETRIRHYDPRSDLFSLGVILYQLLTGRLPYGPMPQESTIQKAAAELRRRQSAGPEPIRTWNKQVDRRLARLIESCLEFEPDERPETAQQLSQLLRRELSLPRRGRRWAGNHRGTVLSAASLVFAAVLAISLFVALRPSYDAQQLQLGLAYCDRGDYASAIDCLGDVIRVNRKSADALYGRAQAYYRLGDYSMAISDFVAAMKLQPTATGFACEGYCLSQLGQATGATDAYTKALDAGFEPAAVLYNNLGHCHLAGNRLAAAERALQKALQLDDRLQAVHYNLGLLYLQQALHSPTKAIPETAFVHVARAIEIGPVSGNLYYLAAMLYSTAAENNSTLIPTAIEYWGKAVEYGCDPTKLDSDPSPFPLLKQQPAFYAALKRQAKEGVPLQVVSVLDPLQASDAHP
jgi:serine/threonine protein kinase